MDATGLKSGQVYRALSKLEEGRLVQSTWEDPRIAVSEGRPRRRYYRLTPAGEKELRRSARRFRELADGVVDAGPMYGAADAGGLDPTGGEAAS